jgi:hypothetical protein
MGDDDDNSDGEDILDSAGPLHETWETNSNGLVDGSDTDSTDVKKTARSMASNDYKSTQGHIENNYEIEGGFEGVEWAYLPSHVKEAAKILGYSRRLWDVGGTVEAEKKLWDHLTNKEKEAATTLGHNKVSSGNANKSAGSHISCDIHVCMPPCPHFLDFSDLIT